MVGSSKVRIACPSISFLFVRLGGSLGIFPHVENFVFKGNSLGVVLTELCPLLRQSLDWFEGLVREREIMSKVRSSELDTGLSSSGEPVEGDTAVSTPREVRAFYALEEACGLDAKTVARFKDRFQFPARVRVRRPGDEDRAYHFFPGEICFYEAAFSCGLRFPVHPFIMELLDHFGIAPGQLMPNSWRIVVNCMEVWLAAVGDMIKVGELVHMYRLKESKEYGYYELVPWERKTRIVKGLPLSFRYLKSRFFFVSGDDFETLSSREWGDVPRLLRRWATPTLGALVFLPVTVFLLSAVFVVDSYLFFCVVKRRPKLKSRYTERVKKAIEYAPTIENWDDLVDPRTLAFYNLGPNPSAYILHLLSIEEKKSKY